MDKPKNRVTVVIMGEEYTVKSTSSPESMLRAARLVDQMLRTLSGRHASRSSHKLAILTALNLAHRFLGLKEEQPGGREEI
ncbi:MAG TPA: cell division protein ZapA [Firmicutes bacterium]|nr:cell division protein ZapA [Bacillota bacterium]